MKKDWVLSYHCCDDGKTLDIPIREFPPNVQVDRSTDRDPPHRSIRSPQVTFNKFYNI